MHVLLIGSGGREHALAWKLSGSPRVERISVAPGNPGMCSEAKVERVAIGVNEFDALLDYARAEAVDLTIVGPEAPLVGGIVDRFHAAGRKIFGPTASAARLEGSKAFAKSFMQRHGIPTADSRSFTALDAALEFLDSRQAPIVIKADGLAAGKGVVVAESIREARDAVRAMLEGNRFGAAGACVVIEDFLPGEEASFIAMVDGTHFLPLASSQDHKPRDDDDKGPNTGGMGACSPAPIIDATVHQHILSDILEPTVAGLAADGMPFTGFLYAGLMIDAQGEARVVEYNVRLGDPETEPLMLRLQSDLAELIESAVDGSLASASTEWTDDAAIGIVLAAGEYPAGGSKGEVISGIDAATDNGCRVFHAGTMLTESGNIATNGGRVLCVTALGSDICDAKRRAESGVASIHWPKMHYRRDIGFRAIARQCAEHKPA